MRLVDANVRDLSGNCENENLMTCLSFVNRCLDHGVKSKMPMLDDLHRDVAVVQGATLNIEKMVDDGP